MHDWRAYVREQLPALEVGPARENEIVAELALQLEQAYNEALAGGATDDAAAARARSQIRDWRSLSKDINAAETPVQREEAFSGNLADLRYATRFLRRNPVFTAIAVGTLAFGIGGNTAIFTLVDALVLRGLPYHDPGRLMAIETRKSTQPELEPWTSILDFADLKARASSFSAVAAISPIWSLVTTGTGGAERLESLFISAEFFSMLGVRPALGRAFLPEEDTQAGGNHVVILSHSFWQRRFGGSRDVLGKPLVLDSGPYTVVGVLPAGFRYDGEPLMGTASEIDLWCPLAANQLAGAAASRSVRFLKVVGRLKPGVAPDQARDDVRRISGQLEQQYPDTNRGMATDARALHAQVTGPLRVTVLLLLGAVGFVLLMACANVANLLLARAAARQRELAVRAALGASRGRILRQLFTEGLVLAAAGGLAGVLLAHALLRLLVAVAPSSLVRGRTISLDARAILFSMAAVIVCTLISGLLPAWRIVRARIETALREGGRGLTGSHHRLRSVLVGTQVAVALLLLVGAALLIRSFQHLLDVDPGFQVRNLLTISVQVPSSARTPEQRTVAFRMIRDQLAAMPGVRGVAAVSRLPLQSRNLSTWMFVDGRSAAGEPGYDVEYRVATANYFETMGIPLRAGRYFDDRDDAQPAAVILINETAARRYWPGVDPVGKRARFGANPERFPWVTIVGVVGDLRHVNLEAQPGPEIYRPYAHNPLSNPILAIRTETDASQMINPLSARIRSLSAEVPVYNASLMETLVDRSAAQRRFVMWLLTGFALSALLLAGVGVYGTVSQSVTQRTRELGLRMALGASPAAVLRLVFQQGLRPAAIGIAIGALAAAGLTRVMSKMLFEVRPLDPAAFAAAAAVLGGFAALACYIPARRATRVDPLTTLRDDC